jgi:hypothetical protein
MRSAGVDWRFDFLLAAVVAAGALAALPVGIRAEVSSGSILALAAVSLVAGLANLRPVAER